MDADRLMRSPRRVLIEITAKCNLRCRYCSHFDNPGVPEVDLPTNDWLTFFDELGRLAVMEVILSGGEPFCRRDLQALLSGIVANRMRFSILSNGALINEEIAAFVAATGRCHYIQISLDGSQPSSHDAGRGKGAFEGAVRGLRILKRHGISSRSRITIHRHNIDDLEATADFLLGELGAVGIGTNTASFLGSCRDNADDLLLDADGRQRAMEILARLHRRWPGRITANAGPGADLFMWNRMLQARRAGAAGFDSGGRLTACGCPTAEISVRSDGAIIPCSLLGHMAMGRINRDSLAEIWTDHPQLNALRHRRAIPLDGFETCRDCGFRTYCTGNCPALALTMTGEIDRPSPDGCLRRFLASGGSVPALPA
jgi:Fe-coproporphyrin III synthase